MVVTLLPSTLETGVRQEAMGLIINQDSTRTALALATAVFCPDQTEVFPQDLQQGAPLRRLRKVLVSVNAK